MFSIRDRDDPVEPDGCAHAIDAQAETEGLWRAAQNDDLDAFRKIIEDDPNAVKVRGKVGETILHMCVLFEPPRLEQYVDLVLAQCPRLVELQYDYFLVQKCTQIDNKKDKEKGRAFPDESLNYAEVSHYRAVSTMQEVARTALRRKVPEWLGPYDGESVLHIAIVKQNVHMVRYFLARCPQLIHRKAFGNFFGKASFEAAGMRGCYYGELPLSFAVATNQPEMVRVLCLEAAQADVWAQDQHGNTALHIAVYHGLLGMYRFLLRAAMAQMRLHGLDGATRAVRMERLELMRNNEGLTPFVLAAELGRTEMVSSLLRDRSHNEWAFGPIRCSLFPLAELDGTEVGARSDGGGALLLPRTTEDEELRQSLVDAELDRRNADQDRARAAQGAPPGADHGGGAIDGGVPAPPGTGAPPGAPTHAAGADPAAGFLRPGSLCPCSWRASRWRGCVALGLGADAADTLYEEGPDGCPVRAAWCALHAALFWLSALLCCHCLCFCCGGCRRGGSCVPNRVIDRLGKAPDDPAVEDRHEAARQSRRIVGILESEAGPASDSSGDEGTPGRGGGGRSSAHRNGIRFLQEEGAVGGRPVLVSWRRSGKLLREPRSRPPARCAPSRSTLDTIVKEERTSVLSIPLVQTLLNRKWDALAAPFVKRRLWAYLAYLAAFSVSTAWQAHDHVWLVTHWHGIMAPPAAAGASASVAPFSRVVSAGLLALEAYVVIVALLKGWIEWNELAEAGPAEYFGQVGAAMIENCSAFVHCNALLLAAAVSLAHWLELPGGALTKVFAIENPCSIDGMVSDGDPAWNAAALAADSVCDAAARGAIGLAAAMCDTHVVLLPVSSLAAFMYSLWFLIGVRSFGPLVVMVLRMLRQDVFHFGVIAGVVIVGFAHAHALLTGTGFFESVHNFILAMAGSMPEPRSESTSGLDLKGALSSSVVIMYVLLVTVVLINVLVAMLNDSYASVSASSKLSWQLERARIISSIEQETPVSTRGGRRFKYWVVAGTFRAGAQATGEQRAYIRAEEHEDDLAREQAALTVRDDEPDWGAETRQLDDWVDVAEDEVRRRGVAGVAAAYQLSSASRSPSDAVRTARLSKSERLRAARQGGDGAAGPGAAARDGPGGDDDESDDDSLSGGPAPGDQDDSSDGEDPVSPPMTRRRASIAARSSSAKKRRRR